ncbi:ArsR/SmtB family transcription factor [Rhizobium mayense]|uniref:Metalloregulator ArsR/SmtB family transcription factor n=1 Tax=Rhizobium mayense TaxID=1312184 RepID=A0ABT7K1M0_9HYPH|nr:metalloregulator ArsR/SmtB family transcription factor [Rhizobium mayense]MDL2402507.1 metalloregulator ArsR/SmtB family transcription factor [Rhizobium mayense]
MSDVALFSDAMQDKAAEAADFMRLFGTPSRLMLLCHIAQKERSVGEIQDELGFKQPALSQQLAELRQAGVVRTRRESRQIYYSIADDRVAVVMEMLMEMFCGTVPATPAEAPAGRGAGAVSLGEMARWARLDKTD